ncbi:MAG: hypothetical protein GF330_13780 [Candidatus Eisenbacteria bacterium]|nr:hypothetical protein [Candidatus Eisenbacteria bacterium]
MNRSLSSDETVRRSAPAREAVLRAHPLLDPDLQAHHPELHHALQRTHQRVESSEAEYQKLLNLILQPPETERPFAASQLEVAYFLNEAARYLEALLELLPRRRRSGFRPLPVVRECNDVRELLALIFDRGDERLAFEARRKLYLGRLFFAVERNWHVQRGEVHRTFLEDLLRRRLFRHVGGERQIDIAFNIAADGLAIDYAVGPPLPEQEAWRFDLREIALPGERTAPPIRVYFYSCRSKREVLPFRYVAGQRVQQLRAVEKWSQLSLRRDASIISKMLRLGISDPGAIPDILGLMFIVEDAAQVERLFRVLSDMLGGVLRVRDIVNTLTRDARAATLNPYSGAGYRVFKAVIDMLYREPGSDAAPYNFAVELQLYTLESYLRTIHTRHYANHQALKRRQFVEGLAPLLFPERFYGALPRGGGSAGAGHAERAQS